MKARKFNSGLMPKLNHEWAARVLNMEVNPSKGPDLISDEKFIELKFCLTDANKKYPKSWTVSDKQLEYDEFIIGQGFWGLGLYELDRPVKEIKTISPNRLESMVLKRELYIVNWSWMTQFSPHEVSGKTPISEWEDVFRYPKFNNLPTISKYYKVEKGFIYLTENIPDYLFNF
ncbi:MAG: hypothetical protein WC867_00275 [Candidatus Pacearchaeota archaeon]|jgi:hypothetical protein